MEDELLVKILSHLESMNNRLQSIEQDISAVKTGQTKMENGLTTKVTALFDGWQQHEEYFDANVRQLEHIEKKLDKLELATTKIGSAQEQHSALLAMLASSTARHESEITGLKRAK
ncbi:MAG: hypothetical protein ABFC84_18030 [Veillonellales bacterium]